ADERVANVPYFVTQPSSTTVVPGAAATFSSAAVRVFGGVDGVVYQWNRNGVPIAGATAATYTTPPTTLADHNALYSVVATAPPGATLSRPARLSVVAPPPPPPPPNAGLDRYVDAAVGDDANSGTAAAPYRRISKAIANVASGGTVWLKDGLWDESIDANLSINDDGLNCARGAVGGATRGDPLVTGTTIRAVNPGMATVRFKSWFAFCVGDTRLVGVRIEGDGRSGIHAVYARHASQSSLSGVSWHNAMVYVENGAKLSVEPAGLASYGDTGKIQDSGLTAYNLSTLRVRDPGSEVVVRGGAFDRMAATGGRGSRVQVSDCPNNAALFAFRGARLVLDGVDVRYGPRRVGDDPYAIAIGLCQDAAVELKGATSVFGFAPVGAAVAMARGKLLVDEGSLLSANQYGVFAESAATGTRVDITLAGRSTIQNSLADGIFVDSSVNTVAARPLVTLGTGTTIRGSGRHGLALAGSAAGATGIELALDGATVADNAGAGIDIESGQACRVRNATITGNVAYGIHLHGRGQCDLGSAASPGGNTLRNTGPNLRVASIGLSGPGGAVDISAVGNTWLANEQGADAQGRYALPAGQTTPLIVIAPVTAGRNYRLEWFGPGYAKPTLRLAE
ncbi:MAG: right-handed parallel beta-helix repeat-containing protein, partial [Caldimonas sp.]